MIDIKLIVGYLNNQYSKSLAPNLMRLYVSFLNKMLLNLGERNYSIRVSGDSKKLQYRVIRIRNAKHERQQE